MAQHRTKLQLLALLLLAFSRAVGADAERPATVFSDELCEAPFVLSVPADLVRTHHGLTMVLHDDGAGRRLTCRLALDSLTVSLRRDGRETELARAAVPLPAPGRQIVVKRLAAGFAVAYDGSTVLRRSADLPDGGRWGLVGLSAAALSRVLLQPTAEIAFNDDFMRTPDEASPWEYARGQWRIAQLPSAAYSANAFTLLGSASGAPSALALAGEWFWEDLTVEASLRPSPGSGSFGLALACQAGGAGYLLRFRPEREPYGLLQLLRLRAGSETVLAECPATAPARDWHRLVFSGVAGRLTGTLDGVATLTAQAHALAHGQVGLWVSGSRPVAFDDVTVCTGPALTRRPVVLSHEAQLADPGAQSFLNDPYMQGWADERDQWLASPQAAWHTGYYWGDVALSWELPEGGLTAPSQLRLCVPAQGDTRWPQPAANAGCALELAPAAAGGLALALREGERTLAQTTVPLPSPPAEVTFRRVGDTLEAVAGGKVVAEARTTLPAAGKVGFSGPGAGRQAGRLEIVASRVIDSTFRAAPTDWTIGAGDWGVASRWACSPRWSWFQGRGTDLASIWSRRRFVGDVIVEFFAGVSMDQPWAPFYRHPGNLAVTLCGADGTPGSGYSLVFAGWGNTATGIFRRDRLVAQAPRPVMPDIVDSLGGAAGSGGAHELHNEWRQLRAERLGATVRLLVDGQPAVSFTDPDPLPGGTVGIWTLNGGITVARARVYYERDETDPAAAIPPAALPPRPALTLPQYGPPRLTSSFERDGGGWHATTPGSAEVAVAERGGSGAGRCLRLRNPVAGGRFAVAAPFSSLDLRTHPLLAFDYALPVEVHVDLFVRVAGERYRVALSGPAEAPPGIEDLGRVPGAAADGTWRTARLDLLGMLRPYFPGSGPVVLQALEFTAEAAPEYLRAGIGGNPAGACWRLDNVYLGAVSSGPVSLPVSSGASVLAPGFALRRQTLGGRSLCQLRLPGGGVAPLSLQTGARAATDLLAFDSEPPVLAPAQPAAGASWLGPELTVTVCDRGPAGVDDGSLELRLDDRRFALGDPGVQWHAASGTLSLDLREAAVQLPAGHSTTVTVAAADRAGNRATPLRYLFTPAPQTDVTPPEPPRLAGLPEPLLQCDFETGAGPLRPWGPDAGVALRRVRGPVAGNPAGAQWCLQARTTKLGGLCGLAVGVTPFEASRYPVLQFDYRAPRELRVDLVVTVDGSRRVVKFTDNDHTWPVLGHTRAVADDRWHRATVDLGGLLAAALGRPAPLAVTELAFASSGWPGNREGLCWYLDNVRLSAALSVGRLPAALALRSQDESGVAGFSWSLDKSPDTAPPADLSAAELGAALPTDAGGLAWLHAAARDAAGNRSLPAHLPLRLMATDDATAPGLGSPVPAQAARACPRAITARVTDAAAGVSPADLRLTINGRTWTVADEALTWNAASGQVTWTLPPGVSLGADGALVYCRLEAADLAGNAAPPLRWTFTLDYGRDREPPAAPEVSYLPARCADSNGFEAASGGWGNFLSSQVLRQASGGATGPGCLELRHTADHYRRGGFVLVRDFSESWRNYPRVRLRYRTARAPGATVQLLGTTFDGAGEAWTPLGSFATGAEGWQTAEVDLTTVLGRLSPTPDLHRLFLSVTLPPDGVLLVDDYAMYSPATARAAFRWAAPASPSGIIGYSWLLDAADATVPPEKVKTSGLQAQFDNLKPGRHVFHLRACSGAGVWGPPRHVAFELRAAPPQP